MLGAIRKRKNSPVVLFILGLALLAMAAFGITTSQGGGASSLDAAKVNGEPIRDVDYSAVYSRVFSQRQRQDRTYDRAKAEQDRLRERVLEELVVQKLLAQRARELKLAFDDDALRDALLAEEAFHVDGRFDLATYERFLNATQTTPQRFEEAQREERLAGILRSALRSVGVSAAEVRQAFWQERERVVVRFVQIKDAAFEPLSGEVTEAEATAWAESPGADAQIDKHYARHKGTRYDVAEQVCARHVLIRTGTNLPPDLQAEKRSIATAALAALKGGLSFAETARKYSEDNNKDRGGDLGCFAAGEVDPRIEEEAFKLQVGEVSPLFESALGLHFLEVTERRAPIHRPLADARAEIARELAREARAHALARAKAEALREDARAKGSIQAAVEATRGTRATKEGAPEGALVLEVETSQAFPRGREFVPPLGFAPAVAQAAWRLTSEEPLSPPVEVDGGFVVLELVEVESPSEEDFEAARPMLEWQLSQTKVASMAEGWAKAVQQDAKIDINPYAISYDDTVRSRMRR